MNILLVSATIREIEPFLNKLGFKADKNKLNSFSYKEHSIDVLITGVGMVATAFYLGKALNSKCDLALNAGLAGAFNRNIDLGTVVNITHDRFPEMGAEDGDKFLSLAEIKLQDENEFPFQKSEIVNISNFKNQFIDELSKMNGITVNTVHGNELSIQKMYEKYHPYVESMEGAAFLYGCLKEKVPCVQIRAISNYVEKRNREAWNIPLAIKNLNDTLFKIIDSI